MARQARVRPGDVPNLPSLTLSITDCWREIRAAQAGASPSGPSRAALAEAGEALKAAVDRLTGQSGFLSLTVPEAPRERHRSVFVTRDGHPVP